MEADEIGEKESHRETDDQEPSISAKRGKLPENLVGWLGLVCIRSGEYTRELEENEGNQQEYFDSNGVRWVEESEPFIDESDDFDNKVDDLI